MDSAREKAVIKIHHPQELMQCLERDWGQGNSATACTLEGNGTATCGKMRWPKKSITSIPNLHLARLIIRLCLSRRWKTCLGCVRCSSADGLSLVARHGELAKAVHTKGRSCRRKTCAKRKARSSEPSSDSIYCPWDRWPSSCPNQIGKGFYLPSLWQIGCTSRAEDVFSVLQGGHATAAWHAVWTAGPAQWQPKSI